MTKKFLSVASMEKLFDKANIKRSSDKAKVALKVLLEDIAVSISKKAVEFARHAGRKTVKRSDIKLAVEVMGKK